MGMRIEGDGVEMKCNRANVIEALVGLMHVTITTSATTN